MKPETDYILVLLEDEEWIERVLKQNHEYELSKIEKDLVA